MTLWLHIISVKISSPLPSFIPGQSSPGNVYFRKIECFKAKLLKNEIFYKFCPFLKTVSALLVSLGLHLLLVGFLVCFYCSRRELWQAHMVKSRGKVSLDGWLSISAWDALTVKNFLHLFATAECLNSLATAFEKCLLPFDGCFESENHCSCDKHPKNQSCLKTQCTKWKWNI